MRERMIADLAEVRARGWALADEELAPGVRSVGEVYMHLASANFFFPTLWGIKPPADVDVPNLEKQGGDKAKVAAALQAWPLKFSGTEGYPKAEVTLGGVDTRAISSKTMEARQIPGLFFIGEVVDVTGWLGGYNFQWAWASGHAAGQVV